MTWSQRMASQRTASQRAASHEKESQRAASHEKESQRAASQEKESHEKESHEKESQRTASQEKESQPSGLLSTRLSSGWRTCDNRARRTPSAGRKCELSTRGVRVVKARPTLRRPVPWPAVAVPVRGRAVLTSSALV